MNEDRRKLDGVQAGQQFTPEQIAQTNAVLAQIEQPVKAVVHAMLAGLVSTFPNVPPQAILAMAAMQAGIFMGSSVVGDLTAILQIRRGFKDAFVEGISKVPPNVRNLGPVPSNLKGM